ncbi:hypothetical protein DL240_08105 [Lujinxingia litoralis]|uniref:Tetratricopeptide repeat protein n=1 Tax=Lujinxingia litoralis TaxID=2211119 RepID=A0A328CBI6_9DELT|nr:hypothetical protein [Lujinxingia litoralis]RAL22847.1 hypothetical protein DL240_08105 [Lujinxingia litoralis]
MTLETIEPYLERAEALWSDEGVLPDAERLRTLALETGLTQIDSESADRRALDATAQARELLDAQQTEEAVGLLRQAVLLSPVRLEPHMLLARHYAGQFESSGDTAHRQQARQLAIRCQTLSPKHTPSAELLRTLGMIEQRDTMSWKQAALITAILVGISATMSLCTRYTMTPPVDENARQEIRDHFENTPPPEP